jgi:hypothetical protein
MKNCIFLLFTLFVCNSANAQIIPFSIEISSNYQRSGFYGYEDYQRDGGFDDGSFKVLASNANQYQLNIRGIGNLGNRNQILIGIGFTIVRSDVNLISGWTGGIIESTPINIGKFNLEVGHRLEVFVIGNSNIYVENIAEFAIANRLEDYNLNQINLTWKPGIQGDLPLVGAIDLVYGIHYGLGLIDASTKDYYQLTAHQFGGKIGVILKL